MIQVTDARQTRVYQQGREQSREESLEEVALRLLELERPIAEIAKATKLSPAKIRKLKKDRERK